MSRPCASDSGLGPRAGRSTAAVVAVARHVPPSATSALRGEGSAPQTTFEGRTLNRLPR